MSQHRVKVSRANLSLIARPLVSRRAAVFVLIGLGKAQHALRDNVALDLGSACLDRVRARAQEKFMSGVSIAPPISIRKV